MFSPLPCSIRTLDVCIDGNQRIVLDVIGEESKTLLALSQFLLELSTCCEVTENLAVSLEMAVAVAVSRHDPATPKAAAVAPQMPALIFRAALTLRRRELLLKLACRAIFGREKDVSHLTQDFRFRVAENTFRSPAPTGNPVLRVKGDKRIISDTLGENLEMVLGGAGGLQLLAALSKFLLNTECRRRRGHHFGQRGE